MSEISNNLTQKLFASLELIIGKIAPCMVFVAANAVPSQNGGTKTALLEGAAEYA